MVARQPPRRGATPSDLAWMVEYDVGVDPEDPEVVARVELALAAAQGDVGA